MRLNGRIASALGYTVATGQREGVVVDVTRTDVVAVEDTSVVLAMCASASRRAL